MDQLLVQIPKDLKTWLKTLAAERGGSIKNIVVVALENYKSALSGESAGAGPLESYTHSCSKCGVEWRSIKADPTVCPSCKSYSWKVAPKPDYDHACIACDHEWSNKIEYPLSCPCCKSRAWSMTGPAYLREKFAELFIESGLSTNQVAPGMRMDFKQVARYVQGKDQVTVAHVELLEKVIASIGLDDGTLPFNAQ